MLFQICMAASPTISPGRNQSEIAITNTIAAKECLADSLLKSFHFRQKVSKLPRIGLGFFASHIFESLSAAFFGQCLLKTLQPAILH